MIRIRTFLAWLGLAFNIVRLSPHIIVLSSLGRDASIQRDIERWTKICLNRSGGFNRVVAFVQLMARYPEFRNLFYYRAGWKSHFLRPFCKPMSTLFIRARAIGPGLFIQHGVATLINGQSIGENCWINQQVTIGYSNTTDRPVIGNNVTINAGAKVIGGVTIGDNSIVGANAVVVKNVPRNVTVVGVPAYIVRRDGKRVTESL